jgi:dipeptidyl-peptidase-4
MSRTARSLAALLACAVAVPLASQSAPAAPAGTDRLTVDRIFRSREFAAQGGLGVQWLRDGRSMLVVEDSGIAIVDAATGTKRPLVKAASLVDEAGKTIVPEDVQLSADGRTVLVFHSSVRVWRTNTRGVYHVIDVATGKATRLATPGAVRRAEPPAALNFLSTGLASGAADPELQQFAKFDPTGRTVAFVRANDLWVRDLATGAETRLTTDGTDDIINGTSDWVYEEELGLRDAFRWSPDGTRIAFWRFDQREVKAFPIVDETAALYPRVSSLRYPKAGEANSRVTLHVIDVASKARVPLAVGPDTGQYLTRLEWVSADSIAVQRLPRRQDRLDLLMVSARTGTGRTVLTDTDSAYVNAEGEPVTWLGDGARFLLRSDRSGFQSYWLVERSGRIVRRLGPDKVDVLDLLAVDEKAGVAYMAIAEPSPTQRQLWAVPLDGRAPRRLSDGTGTVVADMSPTGAFVITGQSALGTPATVALRELPRFTVVRQLTDNAALKAKLAGLGVRTELFRVPMPDGTQLDAYRILPPDFDPTRRHPVLMHAYGGPASPQVNDAWGGSRFLWHAMLAQQGTIVVVVDNRGAAWRGRDFRKVTQFKLGLLETQDQLDAIRWLGTQSWVDAKRIGFWGWSFGGYLTSMVAAKGGELVRAAIAVAPVTDWRYYDSIYTERFMWVPQENGANYQATAPLTHVEGMRARFLLVHGTGDDNVHSQNALALANRMVNANRQFEMLLYPNRTHSISGGMTTVHLYEAFTRFLKENL